MPEVTLHRAQAAKAAALRRFKGVGEIVGVGITRVEGQYAVKINLSGPPPADVKFPPDINGVAVCVEVAGRIHPR
ncbi:MAG TPA: hypothetical protein VF902_03620 [Coriobacteriia bacterium]